MNAFTFDNTADPTSMRFENLCWPTIEALRALGGSATNDVLLARLTELTSPQPELLANRQNSDQSWIEYNGNWAKTYLKKGGALVNSARGVWALTDLGDQLTLDGVPEVIARARKLFAGERRARLILAEAGEDIDPAGTGADADADTTAEEAEFGSFKMEVQLRDFLANNLHLAKIGKPLKLYADAEGRNGVEYPTSTGPIDILATDEDGAFYVLELKRAASPDAAMGQLARYMGWVMKTIANGKPVYGLIVAKEITERLKFAELAMRNVKLFQYQVAFTLLAAGFEEAA